MKIIDRYILSIFLRMFFGALAVLLTLFIVISFFDLIDDFVSNHATAGQTATYFLLKVPEALMHMTPMAVLISSILAFTVLSRNREVIIMMSCGLSPFRVGAPVLATAVLISALSFLNSEFVVPPTWKEARHLYRHEVKKIAETSAVKKDMIWIKDPSGAIWNITYLNLAAERLHDLTVMHFAPDLSRFTSVISARIAYPEEGVWVFHDGTMRVIREDGTVDEEAFRTKKLPFTLDFDELKQAEKKHQEMNMKEISAYIDRIRLAGYDDTRYRVDMYVKATFPLVSLVMAFIAIPFSIKTGRPGGMLFGVTVAAAIGFLFWFVFSMGVSLGHGGTLPPLLAATMAHLLFILGALYKMVTQYHLTPALFSRGSQLTRTI